MAGSMPLFFTYILTHKDICTRFPPLNTNKNRNKIVTNDKIVTNTKRSNNQASDRAVMSTKTNQYGNNHYQPR